ncbi:MAG: NAD-dependent epimerase/dehydratase family protein [Thermoplasmata archaeon]|nr:NAD-dependent epimerase/dehydratase family protein [Thermoplasmata archaeon]
MTAGEPTGAAVVTGGAGAIGAFLCRALAGPNREIRVVDNLSAGDRTSLKELEGAGRLRLHVLDLVQEKDLGPVFAGASEVWHLAANTDIRRGTADPRIDFEAGSVATFHVLEAARRADVAKVFFASSSVVYGFPTVFPTPEGYGPLLPESHYGAAKLAGEALLSAHCHSYGMKGYIFRFANIIGPGMTHGVMFDFFEKLKRDPSRLEVLGDGRQSKSYLRVEDCVDGMLLAGRKAQETVNVYNLGTRERTSVREIAEAVVASTGGRARIEYTGGERGWTGDIPQQLLSIDRIMALGWTPRWAGPAAVEQTIRELAQERGFSPR